MNSPTYGVVIATYGRPEVLSRALESWSAGRQLPDQFIVVDASPDCRLHQAEFLLRFPSLFENKGSEYICTAEPGSTRQRNLGLRKIATDIVTFADDDVLVPDDFVRKIINFFACDAHRNVGAVLPRNSEEANPSLSQSGGRVLHELLRLIMNRLFVPRKMRFPVADGGATSRVAGKRCYALQGYALTCRAPIAQQLKFDENLRRYAYTEDFDFSFRVGRNHLLFELSEIHVRHLVTSSMRILDTQYLCSSFINPAYLIEKLFPNDQSRKRLRRLCWTMQSICRIEKLFRRKGKSLTVSPYGSLSQRTHFEFEIYNVIRDMIQTLQTTERGQLGPLMVQFQQYIFDNKSRIDDFDRYLKLKHRLRYESVNVPDNTFHDGQVAEEAIRRREGAAVA